MNNNTNTWYFLHSNPKEFKDIFEELKAHGIESLLEEYYPIFAILTILTALIQWVLFIILIFWERFGMDPMKRGIKNRVSFFCTTPTYVCSVFGKKLG